MFILFLTLYCITRPPPACPYTLGWWLAVEVRGCGLLGSPDTPSLTQITREMLKELCINLHLPPRIAVLYCCIHFQLSVEIVKALCSTRFALIQVKRGLTSNKKF